MDVFQQITDHLLPTAQVLLGLTCHQFYSLFRGQIAATPLNHRIWRLDVNDLKQSEDMNLDKDLQLHQVLGKWSGLSGYKYFDVKELDNIAFQEQKNLIASLLKRQTPNLISGTGETEATGRSEPERMLLEVLTRTRHLEATLNRLNAEMRQLANGIEGRLKKQRKMGQFTQLNAGLFFKCPLPDGFKSYDWHNLSAETQREVMRLMKSWVPDVEVLKYELDVRRRLRWSEHMMKSYAEWMQLVDF